MTVQQGWMEQRKFERISAALRISYRVLDAAEQKGILNQPRYNQTTAEHLPHLSQKFHVYHAITRDISLGGMAISGEQPIPEGAHVEIYLQLPQYNVTLTLLSIVARCTSYFQAGKTMYNAGVKLLALNREDVGKMERFLLAEKIRLNAGHK
jgi:c-di-GMP-binding flagellar brake protein YcgR